MKYVLIHWIESNETSIVSEEFVRDKSIFMDVRVWRYKDESPKDQLENRIWHWQEFWQQVVSISGILNKFIGTENRDIYRSNMFTI